MRHCLVTLILGLSLNTPATAQPPTPQEQQRTLQAAREAALSYSSALPDFICTEKVHRTQTTGVHNVISDILTVQLNYFGEKEKYKLVAINGRPTKEALTSLTGLISGGEFGSLLLRVFDPKSEADFKWKSSSTFHERKVTVYTYRVLRSKSQYMVGYRSSPKDVVAVAAGYQGEVFVDDETSRTLRLTVTADDIPQNSGVTESTAEVDYDFAEVAGHKYLLPVRAEAHLTRPIRRVDNVVEFVDYRKFEAESTLSFGTGK